MAFELPKLPYAYNALEPNIDEQTMTIHHTKHHQGYTDKLNDAIKGTDMEGKSIEEIIKNVSSSTSKAVRNNGGGYYNHDLFWKVMSPNGGGEPSGELAEAINKAFGSFADFKTKFEDAAKTQFGSGWAWLIVKADGSLAVTGTPNQDNPLMELASEKGTPIFGIDVWEHAYYLKYQNKRPDYVGAFWNVANWDQVTENYKKAK
ncbi:superoxide dismutase [Bernardetia sp. Wsw4-3y2]|uniref:superoxide dismutase n=1 Tax=unclassified Bernardetia TaxID=2647129 RepID=UPI0030CB2DFE